MATEEISKPPSLPPYPQMILEAIDAQKEADGTSKASISKYMEATYGDMPAGHANLLAEHLNQMKESGELLFSKNNYLRPGADVPVKRGRGRPPKAKEAKEPEPASDGAEPAAPRARGRPKKDPNAPPAAKKAKVTPTVSKTGRGRGRPRKVQPEQNSVEA